MLVATVTKYYSINFDLEFTNDYKEFKKRNSDGFEKVEADKSIEADNGEV